MITGRPKKELTCTEEEIKQLHDLGAIKFIDRYEEKYKNG